MCRMFLSDDFEGMVGFFLDGVIKDEECGILIFCSLGEWFSCWNFFYFDDDVNFDFDVKCILFFGCIGSFVW